MHAFGGDAVLLGEQADQGVLRVVVVAAAERGRRCMAALALAEGRRGFR